MSLFVKISTIGTAPPVSRPGRNNGQLVDDMIAHWRETFDRVLPDHPDLIVVPEWCDHYIDHSLAQSLAYFAERGDRVLSFFQETAKRFKCFLTYPALWPNADGTWRNSIQLIDDGGNVIGVYEKNHPTVGELEIGVMPGTQIPVFETRIGRIGGLICFDLNFAELKERYRRARPDLLLFCSLYHGGMQQQSWAFDCRCHFAGACADFPSAIVSPLGSVLATSTNYIEHVTATVNLDCALVHLNFNEEKLPALKGKYGPEAMITDLGLSAVVQVASGHPSRSVADLLAEFEIETLDGYLDRCRDLQAKCLAR
ncbi:MAG: carbon-nitrogen hydrolase family protein [Capsulimonadaceae bacterium]|nr:carbon-nitrogen hydrolase family protein [Capsulimonadaceae bacterium]